MMKYATIVIATMIGAAVLAHYGSAQQPGTEGRTEQTRQGQAVGVPVYRVRTSAAWRRCTAP